MKKILATILLILISVFPELVFAANTHSTDLERDSSQYWEILDAAQTGLDTTTGSHTILAWIKPETSNTDLIIASKINTATGNGYGFQMTGASGSLYSRNKTGDATQEITCAVGLSNGTWYHVGVVFDNTSNFLRIYLNGEDRCENTGATSDIGDNVVSFQIGSNGLLGGDYFDGLVDNVMFFNSVLSTTTIVGYMNTELIGDESGLQGYWKFNDDAGVDQTANNNDLTNVNTATFSTDVPFVEATPLNDVIISAPIYMEYE